MKKTIFHPHPVRDFVMLPNSLVRNALISFKARGLLAMVLSHDARWEVSMQWLRRQTIEGREAVRSAIRELEQAGYAVFNVEKNEKGRFSKAVWNFYSQPVDIQDRTNITETQSSNSTFGFPDDGLPADGSSTDGFPPPQKTIGQKTISQKTKPPTPCTQGDDNIETSLLISKESHDAMTHRDASRALPQPTPQDIAATPPVRTRPKRLQPEQVQAVNELYQSYPRKVGKEAALKAIAKAIKKVPSDQLLKATRDYAAATARWPEDAKQFIPHPATWFNQGRYEDDPKEWERKERPNGGNGSGGALRLMLEQLKLIKERIRSHDCDEEVTRQDATAEQKKEYRDLVRRKNELEAQITAHGQETA